MAPPRAPRTPPRDGRSDGREGDSDDDDVDDSSSSSDSDSEEEDAVIENRLIVRAKWTLDGARNIADIIEKLHREILYYDHLRREGWDLVQPVDDDVGQLRHIAREAEIRAARHRARVARRRAA